MATPPKKATEASRIDKDAFEVLFKLYHARFLHIAKGYLVDEKDVEDVVQGVFIKLWKRRNDIKIHSNVHGYLVRTLRNACLDHLRKLKRIRKLDRVMILEKQANYCALADQTSFGIIEGELSEQIKKGIANLPPKRKEVFIKRRLEGMANKEIARELNISLNTVENHLTKASSQLRKYLKRFGFFS